MTLRAAPDAPSAPPGKSASSARAHGAISLGAAFALFWVVVFGGEIPESLAAGGLFDALFGGGGYRDTPTLYYGGQSSVYDIGARRYGKSRRHARRHRAHLARAHRHVVERRRVATTGNAERRAGVAERRPVGIETITFAELAGAKTAAPAPASRRTVCVRACDGYFFPLANPGRDADIPGQQATCEKLCPGAQVQLFVMAAGSDKIETATSARGGDAYARLLARINPAEAKSKSCGCQPVVGGSGATSAFLGDSTLRPGDTVVTPEGVRVLKRGSRYPFKHSDFLSLSETRDVPLSNRSALAAIERALKTPYGRLAVANSERRQGHRRDVRL